MTPANTSRPDRSEGVELVPCPVCEMPAEVERRDVLGSTSGLFEMIKIRCLERHWFYMPAASLTPYAVGS